MNESALFHHLHHTDQPLILPNAWDFGSAALLIAEGFPAIGTTSLGVAASAGLPDGTGATRAETLSLATRLARLPVPITVDIEGGFHHDPGAVAEFVTQLAELGIAGVNIEDGRNDSALARPAHQAELIAAIKTATPSTFINARIDTHWLGLDHDSTLTRAEQYTAAGADGIFLPGLTDPDQIAHFVTAIPLPINILYSPTGPSIATLTTLGVRRISTGSLLYRGALAATIGIARGVRADTPVPGEIPTYQTIQSLTQPA